MKHGTGPWVFGWTLGLGRQKMPIGRGALLVCVCVCVCAMYSCHLPFTNHIHGERKVENGNEDGQKEEGKRGEGKLESA